MMHELYFEERIGNEYFYNLVLAIDEVHIYTTSPDSPERAIHRDRLCTRSEVIVKVAREMVRLEGKCIDGEDHFSYNVGLARLDDLIETLYEWEESSIGVVPCDIMLEAVELCKELG